MAVIFAEFLHADGRECIQVGRSPFWSYDGGSDKGDICLRDHREELDDA